MNFKIIIPILLVLLIAVGLLYFSESDTTRLVRAYKYDNPLLCNFVIDGDTRTRCMAVINKDIRLCDNIRDISQVPYCYIGVGMNKVDPGYVKDIAGLILQKCYERIPSEIDVTHQSDPSVTEDKMKEECNTSSMLLKKRLLCQLAYKLRNSSLCAECDSTEDYCLAALSGNTSYLCSIELPDVCNAAFGGKNAGFCVSRGDSCYINTAILMGDRKICDKIRDRDILNDCYLELTDSPRSLRPIGPG